MEVGILNGRVLYTGGAEGVDALAEELARRYDMSVCVIIPPTHSRAVRITPLTESMLHEGLQHVLRANKTLQRSLPNNVLKTGLLQRNYWVVRDTNLVLAFGHFDTTKPHTLQGETGWSVQCACANVPMCPMCPMCPCVSTQTGGTNLTTHNRDLSHVTRPTYTLKTLPSWEADASIFK